MVFICLLLFAFVTVSKFFWNYTCTQIEEYFTCSVRIDSDDEYYDAVVELVSELSTSKDSRRLMYRTRQTAAWGPNVNMGEGPLIPEKNTQPSFELPFGRHVFYYYGRRFEFRRNDGAIVRSGSIGLVVRNYESVTLCCFGLSSQPIKDVIKVARDRYLTQRRFYTEVRRPANKPSRDQGHLWDKVVTKPSRSADTVAMDQKQKDGVLTDINEYLDPATHRWYAGRGIPYRRGYLFHGPTGTGKSSLAWAIAGTFGLQIYCVSLAEPTLTEEDLSRLFISLPRRCVMLLEDIDSAGIEKRQEPEESNTTDGTQIKVISRISLSGVLNAIDGVASHEGKSTDNDIQFTQ